MAVMMFIHDRRAVLRNACDVTGLALCIWSIRTARCEALFVVISTRVLPSTRSP